MMSPPASVSTGTGTGTGGTIVKLPPKAKGGTFPSGDGRSSGSATTTTSSASAPANAQQQALPVAAANNPTPPTPLSNDPNALLDSLDAFTSSRAAAAAASAASQVTATPTGSSSSAAAATTTTTTPATASSLASLDPIDFLNRHYTTETMLVHQLPQLRSAVQARMDSLDDRISHALQRQSETADATRQHVQDAKCSVKSLEQRIRLVQAKALQSEQAVLEITKDMKRLDCAKRHLQRTITILKRLHMLLHAVEQLRLAALRKPFCDYRSASQLVDATRLLLKHFEAYTLKVEQMRLVRQKVLDIQRVLYQGLVHGFRVNAFGLSKTLELEELEQKAAHAKSQKGTSRKNAKRTNLSTHGHSHSSQADSNPQTQPDLQRQQTLPPNHLQHQQAQEEAIPLMTPQVMADGILLIDALGQDCRDTFLMGFSQDHLSPYKGLFVPQPPASANKPKSHSFKIVPVEEKSPGDGSSAAEKPPYALEQVERRFAWYRRSLRDIGDLFPDVFPVYWNFQYTLTRYFLELTKDHLMMLLSGPAKDKDSSNATILLKALQKTILFEKEMTAWLQRDYGSVFLVEGENAGPGSAQVTVRGDDGEALEFDEAGTAVAANSAQGIRIKYERRRQAKQQQQQSEQDAGERIAAAVLEEGRASSEQVPVPPLLGVASSAFDNFMGPYIALEEQSMDELLVASTSNTAVDTRGELPVFTSSTDLFVYIKGSITRCTAMSKGKAFFLLYQAFQDSLKKYAQVLSGKLPSPIVASAATVVPLALAASPFPAKSGGVGGGGVGGGGAGGSGGDAHKTAGGAGNPDVSYKIPPGGEVDVCHAISTCEYCVDTIEALEDLIRDTVDEEYKGKINMSQEQDAYHDMTAKSIRVLVSGLMNRTESGLKAMSSINWGSFDMVGEESSYVRSINGEIGPFVATVRGLIPSSYFRSFCDKFAMGFTTGYYETLLRLKRISDLGTQQLLLDVYNIKTLLLKLPVIESSSSSSSSSSAAAVVAPSSSKKTATIPPAMYTKMVTKQFKRIETLLKLVGTPPELLIDVFKSQWQGGSALDLQTVMSLKGMKRNDMAAMLEKLGLDPQTALKGATVNVTGSTIVAEHVQSLRVQGSDVAAKVNSDLVQMRQKVDDFRRAFR